MMNEWEGWRWRAVETAVGFIINNPPAFPLPFIIYYSSFIISLLSFLHVAFTLGNSLIFNSEDCDWKDGSWKK
jgi:hypothetical protein